MTLLWVSSCRLTAVAPCSFHPWTVSTSLSDIFRKRLLLDHPRLSKTNPVYTGLLVAPNSRGHDVVKLDIRFRPPCIIWSTQTQTSDGLSEPLKRQWSSDERRNRKLLRHPSLVSLLHRAAQDEDHLMGLTCVGEGLVRWHHLLIAEYTVLLLVLEEVEGSRNCFRLMRNGIRKMKKMKKEVKGNAHFMHGWDDTNTRTSWSIRCVQGMSVTRETERRLRGRKSTRTFTCSSSVTRHCWVSCTLCWSSFARCH